MLQVLIINGMYPDYEKNEMVKANIGMQDGKIAYIGAETLRRGKSLMQRAEWFRRDLSIFICMKRILCMRVSNSSLPI